LQVVEDVLAGEVYVWRTQLDHGRPDVFVLQSRLQKRTWVNIEGERYREANRIARGSKKKGQDAIGS
jgi:hypothetical protein